MLVSDRHQIVFIHLRKVAGSSVRAVLAPYANPAAEGPLIRICSRLHLRLDYRRFRFRAHAPLSALRPRMERSRFEQYFKFGFVRHPLDRLVSEYCYIRSHPRHHRHKRVRTMDLMQFARYQSRRRDSHQWPLLCDSRGRLMADFVGRFENLHQDFARVARRLGLPDLDLPHLNPRPAPKPFVSDEVARFVRRTWARDFELFGYDAAPGMLPDGVVQV